MSNVEISFSCFPSGSVPAPRYEPQQRFAIHILNPREKIAHRAAETGKDVGGEFLSSGEDGRFVVGAEHRDLSPSEMHDPHFANTGSEIIAHFLVNLPPAVGGEKISTARSGGT